ncbi:type VI secretion system tip protein TssI/VgrG [Massilia sp.]|uniref:type VI secretion system Vgr family protein n=1 Tax=Massilia sp. TaxID=1882437 RepID=UPI002898407E|nr:type VI secretion system tip protein TssI/VgrG [Massilia sp.]
MFEEGLFYFFEHSGDPDSPSFGSHTLVIADHNGAFAPNVQSDVRFTQPGAVMREDSLDRWRTEWRVQTDAIELESWDYRSRSVRSVSSSVGGDASLTSRDHPGAYAYSTRKQGERIAEHQLQALQARKQVHVGAGTVRTLAPGTTFTLQGHPRFAGGDSAAFTVVRALHMAHNNLDADVDNALTRLLGQCALRRQNDADLASSLHAVGRGTGQRPVYRNRIDAIPASVPYRASGSDGDGQLLHPRPLARGQQTGIVVGPQGAVIHTDRDHRVKVQFHWQRGDASHSRLNHPVPDGQTGAPGDERAGTWVRVATPLAPVAGVNWGSHALPRVGQEVLIDFLDGNIDRPVVIGAVYNGAGAKDAQHNQVAQGAGAATGNAPAWFPGQGGAHAHAAALSGLKSQALQASASGSGAYSQLVFDDSPGQARVALQRHAGQHQGTDELNLGHLRHQSDNALQAAAGFGAEFKTENAAALRAGQGLLLSTDRMSVGAAQLDSTQAEMLNEQAVTLSTELAALAHKHKTQLQGETTPESLAAVVGLKRSIETLQARAQTEAGAATEGPGVVTAYDQPHLQLSSPSGIAALTPTHAVLSAGNVTALTADHDIDVASQGNSYHAVRSGIGLFTYGKASSTVKPNQETGIRMHAASGKVSSQSQSAETRITADKAVTVASVTKSVNVAAREHVLLAAQGAALKLFGGNIEIHGPGTMAFKASMKELTGPEVVPAALPALPKTGNIKNFVELNHHWPDLSPVAGGAYRAVFFDGTVREGILDDKGFARLENIPPGPVRVYYGEDPRPYVPPALEDLEGVSLGAIQEELKKLGYDTDVDGIEYLLDTLSGRNL